MNDLCTLTVPHDLDAQGLFRAISETIAERDRLRAEVTRLTGCLERANAQAEKFEREWYLRGEVLDATEYWLGSLLAVIHRDGGHYQAEHGMQKASDDAITAVHVLRGSLEGYVEANRHMKGEFDDALEDARKYAEAQKEIARRVEYAYREAVDTLNPCFATADALWEGSDARKQLEAK